ncbi:hypothetical protein DMB65_21355 [Flavobacterium cheongpyeongense]|uniref:Uncharacterized protein n=1 Tax=Flavobacterium cheongpyeongense TaxID=2212651 RepID=A0A2V4BXP0_9FLAO|nr:STM3941 family protein [Flavobacterium cheongpyeongense]PXY38764.1 hypothetical protein DMB65_21355 [Flavobacterium cheongpyeongense]
MIELKLYKSNWKGIRIIALCLPFVIIGIWMISEKQKETFDYLMGWFITSFFGLGIPLGIFVLFDKRPQIKINENGIWDRTTKQNEIKWEQITESYLIDIYNQKFISIAVDETYIFKKSVFSKINKLNKYLGAQELNINLSQIKIDENKLTDFINKIRIAEKSERQSLIKNFSSSQSLNSNSDFKKYFIYLFILIGLALLSLSNFYAFWVIMVAMGIGGLIARWYRGTTNNSKLRKYSERIAYLGFANMVIILLIFKAYDYTSNKIGSEMTREIETYRNDFGTYPKEIKTISDKLNLNPIQKYIANRINYRITKNNYVLELEFLNHNHKEFDTELNEWN